MVRSRAYLLVAAAMLGGNGCSLLVDSSLDLLKCDQNGECLKPDYTCRFDQCVKNKSLDEGQTCSSSVQCKESLFCPAGIPLCSRPCTKIYALDSECGDNAVCAPVSDRDNPGKY